MRALVGIPLMCVSLLAEAGSTGNSLGALEASGISPHHFSGYLNWSSDYVYRGVSLSNNDPAIQASINYRNDNGVFAGWWVSTIEYAPVGLNSEHNVFLGHSQRWSDNWRTDISATYFSFRGRRIGPDNSFTQWQVAATYADQITARMYYADNSYGLRFVSKAAELEAAYALSARFALAGTLGYWDISHLSDETYYYSDIALRYQQNHYEVSLHHHSASAGGQRTYGAIADSGYLLMFAVGF